MPNGYAPNGVEGERFEGRPTDFYWGPFDYSVTKSQRDTCEALAFILDRKYQGFFCSQMEDGTVVMGIDTRAVMIRRDGRVVQHRAKRNAV